MNDVIVKFENVVKIYDSKPIINNINLEVYKGEFLTLLGPSGCGKTTMLRMISGLEHVTSGKVYIDGKDVTNVPPTKRETNTIFQNFALFPHLSVYDNIAFGLKIKKFSKEEIDKKVKSAIKMVNLDGLEKRKPHELSGGQQQRVAIARGIVMNPKVLLLDESLCSLDLKLKKKMQIELKRLQKKLGITFIYVTHDQNEALTMSDRIVIVNKGKIEQIDTPVNIYRNPKTVYVADFIGDSNILKGKTTKDKIVFDEIDFAIPNTKYDKDKNVTIILRPEVIDIGRKGDIEGTITDIIYDGSTTKIEVLVNKKTIKVEVNDCKNHKEGDKVFLSVPDEKIIYIEE